MLCSSEERRDAVVQQLSRRDRRFAVSLAGSVQLIRGMGWNLAAKLSRRDLEEMMAERGIAVDQPPIARAMVALRRANSGMKDFHHMWILSRSFSFDDDGLALAVAATSRGVRHRFMKACAIPTIFSADEQRQRQRRVLEKSRIIAAIGLLPVSWTPRKGV